MEPSATPVLHAEPHDDTAHDAVHADEFYAETNPKYFGLPLGVLLATAVAVIAVGITIVKFLSGFLRI